MSIRQLSEEYMAWVKVNRTEKFCRSQERIITEDVLPTVADLAVGRVMEDMPNSILTLPPDQQKRGLAAHNVVMIMYGWKLKHL